MSTKATCGKHTTLASNSSVRVTRCGCGMMHLTVVTSGVTVQMKEETLRSLGAGVAAALEGLDQATAVGSIIN